MRNLFSSLLLATCVCVLTSWPVAGAVTVEKIDDKSVTGEMLSVADGALVLSVPSTQPTTRSVATTKPSTHPTAAVPPLHVNFSAISRVVVCEPPKKLPPVKAPEPEPDRWPADDSPSVMSSVLGAFFGSSGPRRRAQPAAVTVTAAPASSRPAASSQPSQSPQWQARLSNSDLLNGRIDKWADQKISFRISAIDGAVIDFPADQLAELWCTDTAARAKAKALSREPGPEDVAFVRKDAAVIAVKGLVVSMDADALHFRFDDQDRKIALTKLVGFVQGNGSHTKPAPRFHQRIHLDSDDLISGIWTAASADAITLTTDGGASLRLPMSKIYTIDFVDGRLVYLSDLKPAKVEQTPYFGRVMPWRADQALGGGALTLSDGQYTKGIAMHTRCVLDYDIDGSFERFTARVGFEQPAGKKGTAVLRVLGDGKVLFENADARGEQPPQAIDLDVKSVRHLTIEADFGKTPEVGGRVIWANARLLRTTLPG